MKKQIVTRSQNDYLYNIMQELWDGDHDFIRYKEFGGFQGAKDFILQVITNHSGVVIICDEDCFVINEGCIDTVVEMMQKNFFAYVGVQDGGGLISHRNNSKYNINPFFAVFDCDKIKTKLHEYDPSKDNEYGLACEKEPSFNEPYAGFFYWLNKSFLGANLVDIATTDDTSTVLLLHGKPFLIHSWYSRDYGKDKAQTLRIDKCIEFAIKTKYNG